MALNDGAQGHNQRDHDGPGERGQAGNNGCRLADWEPVLDVRRRRYLRASFMDTIESTHHVSSLGA